MKKRLNYRLWHVPFTEKCVFEWLHKSQGVLKKSLIISIGVEREKSIDLCVFSCFQKKPALFSFGNRRTEEGEIIIIILWLCVWVQFKYSLKQRFSQSHISVLVLWQIICYFSCFVSSIVGLECWVGVIFINKRQSTWCLGNITGIGKIEMETFFLTIWWKQREREFSNVVWEIIFHIGTFHEIKCRWDDPTFMAQ